MGGRTNHYAVLGVPRTASMDEIRAAFRKLALKHHPDMKVRDARGGKDSHEDFLQIHAAYKVLSNPTKRKRYDMGVAPTRMWGTHGVKDTEHAKRRSFVMYDIDAWEAGHGLGKYGKGKGPTFSYASSVKSFGGGSNAKLNKHQEFFLRRLNGRNRRRLCTLVGQAAHRCKR